MESLKKKEVVLVGAGIMSATLGTMLKELAPEWDIKVFESLSKAGGESSGVWNNAGTGHAALCELNYTAEKKDGSIDVTKANKINEQFILSREFWSHLINSNIIDDPHSFIMPLPHMSFVTGEKDVLFLKKRYEALSRSLQFGGMEFSDDPEKIKEWIPLVMEGRKSVEPIAATRMVKGTDVNFETLTLKMFENLRSQKVKVFYEHTVRDIKRTKNGFWKVQVKDDATGAIRYHRADFVFIGGGGGSLPLLQKTGIPEAMHIGGFPVSGLFMACRNPEVIQKHHAKVYGKAKVGAPPMSVPHLDSRFIDNKKALLFGPFAGFTPKFLKNGSMFDLIASVKSDNLFTMLAAGVKERSLTKYLIQQVLLSDKKRMEELREFIPEADSKDWYMVVAGQRVQVIKDTEEGGKGTLQFGTEIITSADGTIAALLGASPGASTAVSIMLELIERCFPDEMTGWENKLHKMIPSFGISLTANPELYKQMDKETAHILGLD
ncbi:malate dehydrogenase (quinone) [Parasporobacterium paucivorans]|uniref:Probable malate:quinone oxidoreductase n=1 Tax=Parasporobacterium paucivorans DSM 15970 TaxID=1122934 RepID=A0A1M6EIR3_9FIRM|nr:malate dehydrogenase (quinone) [Parasporobacterium paucivorans]SHI85385.1 malate dehydrogenase (quinone) [Parasporobacterium paucivorans DSM 15970]